MRDDGDDDDDDWEENCEWGAIDWDNVDWTTCDALLPDDSVWDDTPDCDDWRRIQFKTGRLQMKSKTGRLQMKSKTRDDDEDYEWTACDLEWEAWWDTNYGEYDTCWEDCWQSICAATHDYDDDDYDLDDYNDYDDDDDWRR